MDVVGVVTPLVRGGAQVLHGDHSVLLEVHEKEGVEEDGEGQIEVEGEDELKEKRSCMTMNVDEMRLKNTLSHEVHVTQTSKCDEDYALSVHAHMLCNLRVSVFVSLYLLLMWFVLCLSSVLVLLFMLYSYSFRSQFSVVGGILFTLFSTRSRAGQRTVIRRNWYVVFLGDHQLRIHSGGAVSAPARAFIAAPS